MFFDISPKIPYFLEEKTSAKKITNENPVNLLVMHREGSCLTAASMIVPACNEIIIKKYFQIFELSIEYASKLALFLRRSIIHRS